MTPEVTELPLFAWPWRARTYIVNWQTGAVSEGVHGRPEVGWGFGCRCAGRLVGVYRRPSDDHIVVSAGGRQLDLDVGPVEPHWRSLIVGSHLTLSEADGSRLRVWNGTPGRLFGFLDPAWGDDEDESEDFLLFLSRAVNDEQWRQAVCHSWGVPLGQASE